MVLNLACLKRESRSDPEGEGQRMLGAVGLDGGIGRLEIVGDLGLEKEADVREKAILDAKVPDSGKMDRVVLEAEVAVFAKDQVVGLGAGAEPGGEAALVPEGPVQPEGDAEVAGPLAELHAAAGLGFREGRPIKG